MEEIERQVHTGKLTPSIESLKQQMSTVEDDGPVFDTKIPSGFGLGKARKRLNLFVEEVLQRHLNAFPESRALVKSVCQEYERYIRLIDQQNEICATSVFDSALATAGKELTLTQNALRDKEQECEELRTICMELQRHNATYKEQQVALEQYIDELRATVAAFTNKLLLNQGELLPPDHEFAGPYVNAVKRMATEIDSLRKENVRLSQIGMQQLEAFEQQSAELNMLVDRANDFQAQSGTLKGSLRVMKQYIGTLEGRVMELTATYLDRSRFALTEYCRQRQSRLWWFDSHCIEPIATQFFLNLRNISLSTDDAVFVSGTLPATDTSTPTSLERSAPALISLLESLTKSRLQLDKVAIRPLNVDETSNIIGEYVEGLAVEHRTNSRSLNLAFEESWIRFLTKKYTAPKIVVEMTVTLVVLAERYSRRSINCLLLRLLTLRMVSTEFVSITLADRLSSFREQLRKVETGKKKDKMPRLQFLQTAASFLHPLSSNNLRALALLSVVSIESKSEDISFEAFFEKSSPMYDLISRFIVRQALSRQLQFCFHAADKAMEYLGEVENQLLKDFQLSPSQLVQLPRVAELKLESDRFVDGAAQIVSQIGADTKQKEAEDSDRLEAPPSGSLFKLLPLPVNASHMSVERLVTITKVSDERLGFITLKDVVQLLVEQMGFKPDLISFVLQILRFPKLAQVSLTAESLNDLLQNPALALHSHWVALETVDLEVSRFISL